MKARGRTGLRLLTCLMVPLALSACGGGGGGSGAPQPSVTESTITASPPTVTANGQAQAAITVTLRDSSGNRIDNSSASVRIDATPCNNCTLNYMNSNGSISGTLSSSASGTITLSFSIDGTTSPNTASVDFVAGPASADTSTISLSVPASSAAASKAGVASGSTEGTADGVTPLLATVTLHDANGNRLNRGGNDVAITSSAGTVGPVTDNGDGTYTADVTSIAPADFSAAFSVDGTNSPNSAAAAFAAPPASAASAYMAAWTVETCPSGGECTPSGIYAVDASNPNAAPRQIVSGDLMGPPFNTAPMTVDVERVSYDPSTGIVTQLGAGDLVYAQGGSLYRLDLSGSSPSPEKLSTLALSGLCDMYALAPYHSVFDRYGGYAALGQPTLIRVFGFEDPSRSSDDCGLYPPKEWIIPADGNSTTAPVEVGGDSGITALITTLTDASTGHVEGFLAQSGNDLRLYSPDLSQSTMLKAGIFPDGATINNLNDGVSTNILLDVGSISNGIQHDDLYWVDAGGVTPVTTLTASRNDAYFGACLYSGETFYPWRTEDADGTIYFDYPTSSGFEIEAITAGGTSVQTIYQSQSPYVCDQTLAAPTDGKIVFTQYGSTTPEWQEVAIAADGAATQQPQVLLDESDGELTQYYFSTSGNTAWVEDFHCNDSSCSAPTESVVAVSSDGTRTQSYPNATLAGSVRQGFPATSGQGLYPWIAVAPQSSGGCTSTGMTLYDSATLDPVASPDFGGSNCAWSARIYGPNESFLFGNVSNSTSDTSAAFGLFGAGAQMVILGQYPLPQGDLFVSAVPLF